MATVSQVVIVVSFCVYAWAVLGLVSPRHARLSARRQSVLVWIGSVVLLQVGHSLAPPAPPTCWSREFIEVATVSDVPRCIESGADIDARVQGGTPVQHALDAGNLAVLEALLAAGADVDPPGRERMTPLHRAVMSGNLTMVEFLLDAGADVNRPGKYRTPLHTAVRSQNRDSAIVQALLDAGADVNLDDAGNENWTPLDEAMENGTPAIAQALQVAKDDAEARASDDCWRRRGLIIDPAFFEDATAADVSRCIASGAYASTWDYAADTPLHVAARYGTNPSVVTALLAGGADVAARNDNYESPLQVAARYSTTPAVVTALLAGGADVAVRAGTNGYTPLHVAARHSTTPSIVTALLAGGADLAAQTGVDNDTPLHIAARYSTTPSVVTALLTGGADVAARNRIDYAPLHIAARDSTTPSVVTALLAGGADLAARTGDDNRTPLHVAARYSATPSVVTALLAGGADVGALTSSGRTPLHLAVQRAPREIPEAASFFIAASSAGLANLILSLEKAEIRSAVSAIAISLLDARADPAARDINGAIPLDLVPGNGYLSGTDAHRRLMNASRE